jgi:hypothetical protein
MVAWKRFPLDDNLPPIFGWPVETRHEQMQIGSQSLHDDNLTGQCANYLRRLFLNRVVDVQPWRQASFVVGEVPKDALRRPRV